MEESAIYRYIGNKINVTVAEIQFKFGLDYRQAKGLIDGLVEKGSLVYKEGLTYVWSGKAEKERPPKAKKAEALNTPNADDGEDWYEKRRRELFTRREMLLRRMSIRTDNDGVETEEEDDDAPFKGRSGEEAEKYKIQALKACIERGSASVSMIQRVLPVSYVSACKIMDWMQSEGYISMPIGYKPRLVLITKEQFGRLYGDFNDGGDGGVKSGLSGNGGNGGFGGNGGLGGTFNGGATKSNCFKVFNRAPSREAKRLVDILVRVREQKKKSVTADEMPKHPSWKNELRFNNTVLECMKDVAKSIKSEGLVTATHIAEARLDGVRDTHDRARMEVYERVVYEFKNFTQNDYYEFLKTVFHG